MGRGWFWGLPWHAFEHKGCSGDNIPIGNNFGPQHFLPEHHPNSLQGPDNHVRCHKFRSLQMMVLAFVFFLLSVYRAYICHAGFASMLCGIGPTLP